MRKETPHPDGQREKLLFLQEEKPQRRGAFKWSEMKGWGQNIIHIARIPEFSPEGFSAAYPRAAELSRELRRLFDKTGRLLVGGPEKLLVEQCFYTIIASEDDPAGPPLAYLLETESDMFFPRMVQLPCSAVDLSRVLDHLRDGPIPNLFLEAEFPSIWQNPGARSRLFSGIYSNIFLYLPVRHLEEMRQALAERMDWRLAGFEAVFSQPEQWITL